MTSNRCILILLIISIILFICGTIAAGVSYKYLYINQIIHYQSDMCYVLTCTSINSTCNCRGYSCICTSINITLQLNNTNIIGLISVYNNTEEYGVQLSEICEKVHQNPSENITQCYYQYSNISKTLNIEPPNQYDADFGLVSSAGFGIFASLIGIIIIVLIIQLIRIDRTRKIDSFKDKFSEPSITTRLTHAVHHQSSL